MERLFVAICLCMYWQSSFAASYSGNILVVLPNVEYSEFKETSKLAQHFSKQKYNVTLLSPFTLPETDHLTQLPISGDVELVKNEKSKIYQKNYHPDCLWSKLKSDNAIGQAYLKLVVESDSFRKLIASNDTRFDLIVLEDVGAFGLAVLSEIFKCPLVALLSEPLSSFYDNFVFDQFEWLQADFLKNTHYWLFKEFYRELFIFPKQKSLLKPVVPNGLDFIEALYNTRLVLLPSYQSIGRLIPKYSHVKQIGGYNRLTNWRNQSKNRTDCEVGSNHLLQRLPYRISHMNDLIIKNQNMSENVVVISTRLPQIVKSEIEKLELSIPVKIVQWDVCQMAENQNVKLFIGDGNVYETDLVASMAIPIVRISENRWNQQFLADSLTEKVDILSASIKDKNQLQTVIEMSLRASLMFQVRLQTPAVIMQNEREHENNMANAEYWIGHYCIHDHNLHLENLGTKLDVQNKWIIIGIILIIIDIVLLILFYWIFKHFIRDLFKICFFVIFSLILSLVTKVFRVKLLSSSEDDKVEKAQLCSNDQLEKSDKIL